MQQLHTANVNGSLFCVPNFARSRRDASNDLKHLVLHKYQQVKSCVRVGHAQIYNVAAR